MAEQFRFKTTDTLKKVEAEKHLPVVDSDTETVFDVTASTAAPLTVISADNNAKNDAKIAFFAKFKPRIIWIVAWLVIGANLFDSLLRLQFGPLSCLTATLYLIGLCALSFIQKRSVVAAIIFAVGLVAYASGHFFQAQNIQQSGWGYGYTIETPIEWWQCCLRQATDLLEIFGVYATLFGLTSIFAFFRIKDLCWFEEKPDAFTEATVDCGVAGNGFFTTWLAVPALVVALGYSWAILHTIIDDSVIEMMIVFLAIAIVSALMLIRLGGKQCGAHRKIFCSADGMRFVEDFGDSLLGTLRRPWNTLHSVEFSGSLSPQELKDSNTLHGCFLTLNFSPSGSVTLDLARMKRPEIVKLLLQIEAHSNHFVFSKQAYLFNQIMFNAASVVLDKDEQLDTDKLEAQFSATHFVPLTTCVVLQSGRYKITTQIASGGMSSVYTATQIINPSDKSVTNVVVKECVLPFNTDEKTRLKARELFARESKTLSKLDHPQIVRVLDTFVENEREYIVLEYKAGPTLRQLRQLKGNSIVELIPNWCEQIAGILEYLHALEPPLIHRDLTPDNLILAGNNKIIAIDFGVSNEFLGNATGTLVGKQAYISPEQFRGKSEPKSDIYAFGATMYHLYAGIDPIPLSVSDPRKTSPDIAIPISMAELIIAMTQLSPEKRPSASETVTLLRSARGLR